VCVAPSPRQPRGPPGPTSISHSPAKRSATPALGPYGLDRLVVVVGPSHAGSRAVDRHLFCRKARGARRSPGRTAAALTMAGRLVRRAVRRYAASRGTLPLRGRGLRRARRLARGGRVSDAAQVRAPSACCAVFFAPDLALLPPRRPCRPYRRLLAAVAAGARRVDARRVLPAAAPATASARRLGRESVRPDADRPLRLPVHRSLRPRVRHQHACTALPQRQQPYGVAACVPRMLLAQAREGSLGRGSLRALVVRGASIGARTPLRARTREGAYVYVYAPGSGRYWICPCAGRL
jgi:hypothetical protein